MNAVIEFLANGPSDPLVMAGVLLAIWAPICALGLGLLALLAMVQERANRRRQRRPAVFVPPIDFRPLAMRRYITMGSRSGGAVATVRVMLALAAVAALTAFALASNGSELVNALRG